MSEKTVGQQIDAAADAIATGITSSISDGSSLWRDLGEYTIRVRDAVALALVVGGVIGLGMLVNAVS